MRFASYAEALTLARISRRLRAHRAQSAGRADPSADSRHAGPVRRPSGRLPHPFTSRARTARAPRPPWPARCCGRRGCGSAPSPVPDLHAVNERIAVNGRTHRRRELHRTVLERLSDVESVSGIALTRFELLTVAALLHFSDEGVDVAVIEVGMGGTWDSTNVDRLATSRCSPTSTSITPRCWATTVGEIATRQGGHLSRRRRRHRGHDQRHRRGDRAAARPRNSARRCGSSATSSSSSENELALGGRAITLRTPYEYYDEVLVTLHGIHQGVNAATAIVAAEAFLGRALGERSSIVRRWPTRTCPVAWRLSRAIPMIVIDGAHNPAGRTRARRDAGRCLRRARRASLRAGHAHWPRRRRHGRAARRRWLHGVPLLRAALAARGAGRSSWSPRCASRARSPSRIPSAKSALAHARERSTDDDLIVVTGQPLPRRRGARRGAARRLSTSP